MELVLVKTLGALLAVLSLMGVILLGMKKLLRFNFSGAGEDVEVRVLGSRMLQPKRMVYVVQVLNKVIVVGSTEHGMESLGEIGDPEVIATLDAREDERRREEAGRGSFQKHLRNAESLGDFFHRPFHVVLWGRDRQNVRRAAQVPSE